MYLRKNSPTRDSDVSKYLQNFNENSTLLAGTDFIGYRLRRFRDQLNVERSQSPARSARNSSLKNSLLENKSPLKLNTESPIKSHFDADDIILRHSLTQKIHQKKSIERLYRGMLPRNAEQRISSLLGSNNKGDATDIKEFNEELNKIVYFQSVKPELQSIFDSLRGKPQNKPISKYEIVQFLKSKLSERSESYKDMILSVSEITKMAGEIFRMIFNVGADEEAFLLELLWRCLIYQLELGVSRQLNLTIRQESANKIKIEENENKWKSELERIKSVFSKQVHNLEQENRRLNKEIKQVNKLRRRIEEDKERLIKEISHDISSTPKINSKAHEPEEIKLKEYRNASTMTEEFTVKIERIEKNEENHPIIKLASLGGNEIIGEDPLEYCEKLFNKFKGNGSFLRYFLRNLVVDFSNKDKVSSKASQVYRALLPSHIDNDSKKNFFWSILKIEGELPPHTENVIFYIRDLIKPLDKLHLEISFREVVSIIQNTLSSNKDFAYSILSNLQLNTKIHDSDPFDTYTAHERINARIEDKYHQTFEILLMRIALCIYISRKPLNNYFQEGEIISPDDFINVLVNSYNLFCSQEEINLLRQYIEDPLPLMKIIERLNLNAFYKAATHSTIQKYDLLCAVCKQFELIFFKKIQTFSEILNISSFSELNEFFKSSNVSLSEIDLKQIFVDIQLGKDLSAILLDNNFFSDTTITFDPIRRSKRNRNKTLKQPKVNLI
ncbi:unnamed protein product [Blepharisma stoltei]|uniref:Uncharacterized protein n=1 Tax=Blepharisma stoltei TaxID=1481888 RepID=A0AAU9JNX3_9CILI|nr:unnamed protein product [Blepharisma stoltei]